MAVSMLRTTTAAPGTSAPVGSVTVPVMVPEPAPWEKALTAVASNKAHTGGKAEKQDLVINLPL